MTNLELTNTPNELISQKPIIQAHRVDVYSNFKSKEERKKKRSEKKQRRKEKRAEAKKERQEHTLAERSANVAMKVPLAPVRAGFLAGLRLNIFGMSRKLYPAILTVEEAKKKNINLENRERAIKALKDIEKFYFKLGGRSVSVSENIKKGFNKPIFNTKKIREAKKSIKEAESKSVSFSGDYNDNTVYHPHRVAGELYQLYSTKPIVEPFHNFDSNELDLGIDGTGNMDLSEMRSNNDCHACSSIEGDDDFSNTTGWDDAAMIISAITPLVAAAAKMASSKVANNPYNKNTPEARVVDEDIERAKKEGDSTPPPVNEAEMKKINESAEEIAKKGEQQQTEKSDESAAKEAAGIDDKILGMPKGLFWGGVALLSIGAIALAVKMSKGKTPTATA